MRWNNVVLAAVAAGHSVASPAFAGADGSAAPCPYAKRFADQNSNSNGKRALEARNATSGTKGIFYMNRIGPSSSQLYIANSDGSNVTALMGDQTRPFDYHGNWSPDGQWIVFTSERRGDGQSDIYRVKTDGSEFETLVQTAAFEDGGVLSPDGTKLAYVSTAINYTANVFVKDLTSNSSYNITGSDETIGNFASPHGFFRPQWSPDGEWIAMSSDANTDWTGHGNGTGWEHTQELSIYMVRPNGSDFRKVIGYSGYSLGTPKWSPDGSRLIYNNMTVENTYYVHAETSEQVDIFSVDVATGTDVVRHTDDATVKVGQQYIGNSTNIGYNIKLATNSGINYTAADGTHVYINSTDIRNPSWSPDGTKFVYEISNFSLRAAGDKLWSFDSEWEYRYTDVFPQLQSSSGKLTTTQKNEGNASNNVVITNVEYGDELTVVDVYDLNDTATMVEGYLEGEAGAFQPTWRANSTELAVGFGFWFETRSDYPGTIYLANSTEEATTYENLTAIDTYQNAGFPSFSPDGTALVYRLWDGENGPGGLRILNLTTGTTFNLTWGWDNTPGWSPDGELIVFTRQTNWTQAYGNRWYADRYDVCTIKPDGTDYKVLTVSGANEAHAVWSHDNRIMYSSGRHGFKDEDALYDNTFQPYGQIGIMEKDGSNKTVMTDSMWEDSMPLFVPNQFLEAL